DLPPPFGKAAKAATETDNAAEAEFWDGVKDSDDPDDLALYIERFPRGKFAEAARVKVAALRGAKG
ncbi:MAG: hypothetical protein ACT4P9_18075, partial [Betaproteobacteria bacterium]